MMLAGACRAGPGESPAIRAIGGSPSCPECLIVTDLVATLSAPPEVLAGWPSSAWVDHRGRITITQPNNKLPPAVFDSTGAFLQLIGREGEGPGEYRIATHLTGDAHDSLWITDPGTGRLSIVSPDLQYVRSFALPWSSWGITRSDSGHLVAAAPALGKGRFLAPIQVYDAAGTWLRGHGPPGAVSGGSESQYLVASARGGGFWAMRMFGKLRIVHVDPAGAEAWFERQPDWFVGETAERVVLDGMSWGRTIWEDADGLVWIVFQVPTTEVSIAMDTVRSEGVPVAVPRRVDDAYDTWIEVLDPARGDLVVSQRFPAILSIGASPGYMVRTEETDTGLTVTILRLTLQGPSR